MFTTDNAGFRQPEQKWGLIDLAIFDESAKQAFQRLLTATLLSYKGQWHTAFDNKSLMYSPINCDNAHILYWTPFIIRRIATPVGHQLAIKPIANGMEGSGAYFPLYDLEGLMQCAHQHMSWYHRDTPFKAMLNKKRLAEGRHILTHRDYAWRAHTYTGA